MKIAWYTPYSADSAIGRFSHLVVQALRQQNVEVLILRSETRSSAIKGVPPICRHERWGWASDIDHDPATQLAGYDLVVYNLGDHYDYHAWCFKHQSQVPGLSILHDYSLHHALHQRCLERSGVDGNYRDHLFAEAGSEAVQAYDEAFALGKEHHWWHHEIARFPIYRWALQNTLGVVTHADFYRELVASRVGCPARTIPLAYDTPTSPQVGSAPLGTDRKVTIVTIGSVNENKRYQAVIRALAASPLLREPTCQYRIVGAYDEPRRKMIQTTLDAQPVSLDVSMTGRVDRETLCRELSQADIISCLRYPALEGASGSVVEGLLTGKPVVVSDTGCYREIPPEFVYRIDPACEHRELVATLERIVKNYDEASERGARASSWAADRHAPDKYAKQLLDFAPEILYNRPVLAIVDRLANHLRQWNVPADELFMRRIDATMQGLFGSQRPASEQFEEPRRAA